MLAASCRQKSILLALENSSPFDSVSVSVYRERQLFTCVQVKRSNCADCFKYIGVPLAGQKTALRFVNTTLHRADSCIVDTDSLGKTSFILVSTQCPQPVSGGQSTDTMFFSSLYYRSSLFAP